MRTRLRLALLGAVLAVTVIGAAPAGATAGSAETIVVTCTNGFTRTVPALAARRVAVLLTRFNEYNGKGITCSAAPGAPRVVADSWVFIECTNGFERRVHAQAAGPVVKVLNVVAARRGLNVTCAVAS
jgi:hypothetical protein